MPWSTVNNNDNNNNNITMITLEIKAFFQTLHISKFCIKNFVHSRFGSIRILVIQNFVYSRLCPIRDFVCLEFCPVRGIVHQFRILSICDFVQFRVLSILDLSIRDFVRLSSGILYEITLKL